MVAAIIELDNAAIRPERGAAGYLYKEDGVLDDNCAGIK